MGTYGHQITVSADLLADAGADAVVFLGQQALRALVGYAEAAGETLDPDTVQEVNRTPLYQVEGWSRNEAGEPISGLVGGMFAPAGAESPAAWLIRFRGEGK